MALSVALIAEGSVGSAASATRVPVVAVGQGVGTAPPPLKTLAPTVEQARADAVEGRARAKREADAFMNGSPTYRRAHTLKVVRPTRAARGRRGTSALPAGNDVCILIGDGGLRFGGPNWICWFNDVGVSIDLQSESNPAAATPVWADPDYYCPSPTAFSNNNDRASMLVTENPTSVGGASSCNRLDGPVTSTFTRESTSTDFDHVLVQVQSTFTVCLHPFGNNCTLAIIDNMYVNLRTGTPWTQSATPSERACGRCNGTSIGKPIDVATGELWNEKTDLALSGPFGMSFSRFYGNQTAGSADLGGTHWLHSYSSRLDVTGLSSGAVTYVDSQGMPYYFTSVAAGSSSYDNLTGMTLSLSADASTYTLKSFQGRIWIFNAKGELTQRQDRVGNTQVVSRDPAAGNNDRILSVTDTLGRQLCFFYDASNRITAVSGWMKRLPCPAAAPARSRRDPVVTFAYDTGTNCAAADLCTATDADGKAWHYEYAVADATNPRNLTRVIDPVGHIEESNTYSGVLAVHQESGNCPTSPCAQTGNDITITYPTNGTGAVQIVDGLGRLSVLQFNPLTLQITSISGPICKCGGDQTRYWTYDDDQRVVTVSDDGADGSFKHTVMYYYDRDSGSTRYPGPTRVTELLDTQGPLRTTTLAYYPITDPRHDLVQTTTEPSADSPGQTMSILDTYSTTGRLTQRATTGFVNGASTAYTLQWSYDARGRLLTETGPRNDVSQVTRFAYFPDNDSDSARAGQLQSVTDALGHVSTFASAAGFTSYDPYGDAQSITDPNGVVTELTHDARGRTLSSTLMPATAGDATLVTQSQYDGGGRLTRSTLPAGNSVKYGYDTSGRLTRMVREDASLAVHERMLLTYNAFDQPTSTVAQSCATPGSTCSGWSTTASVSYAYSPTTSALSQIVNADGTSKSVTYSPQGAIATVTDERGAAGVNLRNTYDLAGRKTEVRTVGGRAFVNTLTRFAYDVQDNVISVTDTNHNATTYHYDDFHRLTQETSPVSGVTTYAYDADNNVTTKVNANGTIATFTYDALDRMLTENDMKGTASAAEAWTYDDPAPGHFGIGHLATMTDPSGSTAYTYDRRGNVVVENHNVGGNAFTYGYAFDANGNKSVVSYPDGTSVNYTFDFADRPFSAQQVTPVGVPGVLASAGRRAQTVSELRAKGLAAPPHAAKSELPLHPAVILNPATLRSRRTVPQPARGAQPPLGTATVAASKGRAPLPGAGSR
ncbi:MAG: DUF6531 domain-containing protein, partial [Candidatus Eremiobacteraeota bacterium]|nr:DUF6531 domain-containing protein [Candidatus Eremiobacteraeota bacterium]